MHSTAKSRQETQHPSNQAYGTSLSSAITNVPPQTASPNVPQDAPRPVPSRAEIWLNRLFVAIFVLVCVQMGIMLVVLPWTRFWSDNTLLLRNLSLREFVLQDFVRGAVSGLGLVDIWIGIWEGVHYRESHGPDRASD